MPSLPDLHDLPPSSLARLRALNPELMDELMPPVPQEEANLHALEARMIVARNAAISSFWRLAEYQAYTPPQPKHKDDGGALVFRYAAATVAFLYIAIKAGALG